MLKWLSLLLKSTLTLSVLSLFAGSDVSLALIIIQAAAVLTLDLLLESDGTVVVADINKRIGERIKSEKTASATACVVAVAFGALMFYTVPSFSSEAMVIPDITKIQPYSRDANYMSLEGYVATYIRMNYGKEISRGEARKLVKAALKAQKYEPKVSGAEESIRDVDEDVKVIVKKKSRKPVEVAAKDEPLEVNRMKHQEILNEYKYNSPIVEEMKAATVCVKKVVVLPFRNHTCDSAAVGRVSREIADEFRHKGYSVVEPSSVNHRIPTNFHDVTEANLPALARSFGADLVVTGDINNYGRYKKFRLAGFILGGVVTGFHNYGDVSLSTKIFSATNNGYVYSNCVRERKKQQVMGLFSGTGGVMNESVHKSVQKLYHSF